jgi:hypothetical protein
MLKEKFYARLYEFCEGLAREPDEPVVYESPGQQRLKGCAAFVLEKIATNYDEFSRNYMALLQGRGIPSVGWSIGSFFIRAFSHNPSPEDR